MKYYKIYEVGTAGNCYKCFVKFYKCISRFTYCISILAKTNTILSTIKYC